MSCCFFLPLASSANDYPPEDFNTKRMNNVEAVEKAIELATAYNTVYVNGTVGQKLTNGLITDTLHWSEGNETREKKVRALVKNNYYAFDCSGMVKALLLWQWEGDFYKYNGNEEVNQAGLLDLCTEKGAVTDCDMILPGEFLYKDGHCGIYIGNGYAVECAPERSMGVQITRVVTVNEPKPAESEYATKWELHGKLPFIDYKYSSMEHISKRYNLRLNKHTYAPGEPIRITLDRSITLDQNAIVAVYSTVFPTMSSNDLNNWCYFGSGTKDAPSRAATKGKTVTLAAKSYRNGTVSPLSPGTYKICLHENDRTGVVIDEIEFQVVSPKITQAHYSDGWLEVRISGYTEETAWVGVYPKSVNPGSQPSLAWHYANQEVTARKKERNGYYTARIRFDVSKAKLYNPEDYQAALFVDEDYLIINSKQIVSIEQFTDIPAEFGQVNIGNRKLSISAYKTSNQYKVGEEIIADFSGVSSNDAWVGLYPREVTNYNPCSTGMWVYAKTSKQWKLQNADNVLRSGAVHLHANVMDVDTGTVFRTQPGSYKLVLFLDGGYTSIGDIVYIEIVD